MRIWDWRSACRRKACFAKTCGFWSCRPRLRQSQLPACWGCSRHRERRQSFSGRDALLPKPWTGAVEEAVTRTVLSALAEEAGDVLAFLPGAKEIRTTQALLAKSELAANVRVYPLYGRLRSTSKMRRFSRAKQASEKWCSPLRLRRRA